ncbi:MAG: hypothetical protein Q8930_11305, partial [Bacillota bacterium]|nr:hypothetical protein [Bacillota bacterium]
MKLKVFLVAAIAILVASLLLAYRELEYAGDTTSTGKSKSAGPGNSSWTAVKDASKEPVKEITISEVAKKNQRMLPDSELLIDNKKILDLDYQDLIKIWGKPAETRKIAVNLPGTEGKYILYILKYDSIDIEMFPVKEGITV